MHKLIILLILLSYSCTNDKSPNNIQVANSKTDRRSDLSNQLTYLLNCNEYVENKKMQYIYNRVIKGIRPDMPNDSLKKVLQKIYYCDQIYRDSLMTGKTWISDEIKRNKYLKELTPLDKMNRRIVLYLLNNIGGLPDTRDMGDKASEAIWLVIRHSDEREFAAKILPYLNKAYYSDSVIDNIFYASSFDKAQVSLGEKSKYGAYPLYREYYPDSVIPKINLERIRIGLDTL